MTEHVAVVGGGIVGLLTADQLRNRGHRVSLHTIGLAEAATRAAAGMLAPTAEIQYGQGALWPLMREAAELHRRLAVDLAARTALPTGYREDPTLVLGRDHADLSTLRDLAHLQRDTGAEVCDLLPTEVARREPALARSLAGGIESVRDHQVDPRLLAAAVGDLLTRPEVSAAPGASSAAGPPVEIHRGAVRSTDEIEADRVVLAAGLGVPGIDGPHRRLDLALRPVRGDILRVRAPRSLLVPGEEGLLTRTVRALVRGRPLYLVPRADGEIVIGATSREDDLTGPSTGGILQLLQDAAEILPSVRETELVEVIARDRPGTPDHLPLLGPVPGDERVIVSTGYHRHGILLSPWAARWAAELIDHPALAADPRLAPVRPDRFTAPDATASIDTAPSGAVPGAAPDTPGPGRTRHPTGPAPLPEEAR